MPSTPYIAGVPGYDPGATKKATTTKKTTSKSGGYAASTFKKPVYGPKPKPKIGPAPKPKQITYKAKPKPKAKPAPVKKKVVAKAKGGALIKPKFSGGGQVGGGGGGGGTGGFYADQVLAVPTPNDIVTGLLGVVGALPTAAANAAMSYLPGGAGGTQIGSYPAAMPTNPADKFIGEFLGGGTQLVPDYVPGNKDTFVSNMLTGGPYSVVGSPLTTGGSAGTTTGNVYMPTAQAPAAGAGAPLVGPPTQAQAASMGTNAAVRTGTSPWTARPTNQLSGPMSLGDIPGTEKRLAGMLNQLYQPGTQGAGAQTGKGGQTGGSRRRYRSYGGGYSRSRYRRYGRSYGRSSYRRSYYGGGGGGGGSGGAAAGDYAKFGIPEEYMTAYKAFWGQDQPQEQWSLYQPVMELFSRVMGRMPTIADWQQIWTAIKADYASRTPPLAKVKPYSNLVRYEPIIQALLPPALFTPPTVSYAPGLSF